MLGAAELAARSIAPLLDGERHYVFPPDLDMVLVLPGVNDVSLHLASARGYETHDPALAQNAFFILARDGLSATELSGPTRAPARIEK